MPILNYTTEVAVSKTTGEIYGLLMRRGTKRISVQFGDDGAATGISFEADTEFGPRWFELTIPTAGVLAAMQADKKVPRPKCTQKQAERVAWRVAKDWLEAQLALVDAGLASLDQAMMPYMLDGHGTSAYELYRAGQKAIEQ